MGVALDFLLSPPTILSFSERQRTVLNFYSSCWLCRQSPRLHLSSKLPPAAPHMSKAVAKKKAPAPGKAALTLTLAVAEGLDAFNVDNETIIDLKVAGDMKLSALHSTVAKMLQLKPEDKFYYLQEATKIELDFEKSFDENKVVNSDTLFLESGRKRRKATARRVDALCSTDSSAEVLELVCSTRIFDSEYDTPRRVRVLVCASHTCEALIQDVSALWGRTGLKFKSGRTVLHSDKTFEDQGVCNNAEIVVTGGRG